MKRLLREPLLHFLVGGAVLFGAYAWLNPPQPAADGAGRKIRIGTGEVRWLTETWARQWRREPTREELRGLVSDLLKEELLYREARELRLDENDTIVRRRLAQKLEFLLQDTARLGEPGEEELRRIYDESPNDFLTEPRISFNQVYFSPDLRKDATKDAAATLPKLARASAAEAARMGDRLLIEMEFRDADAQAVASAFGPGFARAVFAMPTGEWRGPVESGYGVHLVRVASADPARLRDFAEVRPQLLERWRERQQGEAEARFFERLMSKYEVAMDEDLASRVGTIEHVRARVGR